MKATRARKPWDDAEKTLLAELWKKVPLEQIAAKFGRSEIAINQMACSLRLGAKKCSGETMASFLRRTGYSPSRVRNAAFLLGIKLKKRVRTRTNERTGGKSRFFTVSTRTANRLIKFLATKPDGRRLERRVVGAWGGNKPKACLGCKRSDVPYQAKGMCASCYDKRRRPKTRVKLPKGKWGVGNRPSKCTSCSRTKSPFVANGMCKRCYYRKYNERKK